MGDNAEVDLRDAKHIPPMRIDRLLWRQLKAAQRKRKASSLASLIRILLRERLAQS